MPSQMLQEMRLSAQQFNIEKETSKYINGASYIPLEAALIFTIRSFDRLISITICNHWQVNNQMREIALKFF